MGEIKSFTAEVGKLLQLVVNNIYSNKDTCIRELISNASDACERLKYMCQFDSIGEFREPKIEIELNLSKRFIRVSDNGIGMDYDELVSSLGSIASSGTREFMESFNASPELIGNFGIGFYSCFMIASRVEVKTRKAGTNDSYIWASSGVEDYSIEKVEGKCIGTQITLHLRPGEDHYLNKVYVENLIKKYANYLLIPIFLKEEDCAAIQVNEAQAIWRLAKGSISREQYEECYQHISCTVDLPWVVLHNVNEGKFGFINLLFIPSRRPNSIEFEERRSSVRLYSRGVFVGDEHIGLIPRYLSFLVGLIESDSVPLNASRETVQKSTAISKIRTSITTRVLSGLSREMALNLNYYREFWRNFGSILKEGLCEDPSNGEKILGLCLFFSLLKKELITLDSYLASCSVDGGFIYYFTGESIQDLSGKPQIEGFFARGVDVLLMTDVVDSFWLSIVGEYKGNKFMSVCHANLDAASAANSLPIINYFKSCLGDVVADVRASDRMVGSAACLVTDGIVDSRLERFLLDHGHLEEVGKKVLEINLSHPLVEHLRAQIEQDQNSLQAKELALLLFEEASLMDGNNPPDKATFCKRINSIIESALKN
jgi:molecular chaperone HtpG